MITQCRSLLDVLGIAACHVAVSNSSAVPAGAAKLYLQSERDLSIAGM